jgi:predicted membrane protein
VTQFHIQREEEGSSTTRLLPGLVLVGLGALFLLDNLHIVAFQDLFSYWPAILIAIGIVKLVDSTRTEGRMAGGILAAIGGLLLAHNLGYVYLGWNAIWPLILIGAGIYLLFQRLPWRPAVPVGVRDWAGNVLDEVAIFGGGKRNINAQDFQGGQITAIFGGVEVDLRDADMKGDSAVIEVNSIFGGASILIPRNWSTVMRGVGVFGGFGDESVQPDPRAPGVKHLMVKGAALFGGVVVKN